MTETKRVTTVREKTTITSSGTHAGKQGSCRQSGHALLLLRQGDSRRLREFFNKRLGTSRVNSSDSKYDEANQINTHASPVAALLVRQGGLGLEPASPQVHDSFVQRTSRGWSCCAWPVAALLLRRQGDVAHRTFTGDKSREAHVTLTERLSCCAWPVAALLLRRQGDVAHRTFSSSSWEAHVTFTERLDHCAWPVSALLLRRQGDVAHRISRDR